MFRSLNLEPNAPPIPPTWKDQLSEQHPRLNLSSPSANFSGVSRSSHEHMATLHLQLDNMEKQGIHVDPYTCVRLLQLCSNMKGLLEGKRLDAQIVRTGLGGDVFIANHLVKMYGRCGSLDDAYRIFEKTQQRDVVVWTSMIAAFAQNGHCTRALEMFRQMQCEGVMPDQVTLVTVLKACDSSSALAEAKIIHARIVQKGYESDVVVGTALMNMYGKCGSLEDARAMFDKMPERNIVSWTAMMAAYAEHKHSAKALGLFRMMLLNGSLPNRITFITMVNACGSLQDLAEVHACAVEGGFESDVVIGTALLNMYSKVGTLEDATGIFDDMVLRDTVSWNAMIGADFQHGYARNAVFHFQQMQQEGIVPDKISFAAVLNSCASLGALAEGSVIHALAIESGLTRDIHVANAILNMYGKCGSLEQVAELFGKMQDRDVASWTALIASNVDKGNSKEALQLFRRMQLEAVTPNEMTFVAVLNMYANPANADIGDPNQISALIAESGFQTDLVVGTAIVTMHGKHGRMADARLVFDRMQQHNEVSWNAMIAAYVQNGYTKKALLHFRVMQLQGVVPDEVTYATVLNACADLAALAEGKLIHARVIEMGLDKDLVLRKAIAILYGKCGSVVESLKVFDRTDARDVAFWNVMIGIYAHHGHGRDAIELFKRMQDEDVGVKPDGVTYVNVLSACSHAGFVDEGWNYFELMSKKHGINPSEDHYVCMVDLLGRAGQLKQAEDFIQKMPFQPNALVWITLLGACKIHRDVERGERAAKRAMELDPKAASAYVLLSSTYL